MKRYLILISLFLSTIATVTSCLEREEFPILDYKSVASDYIIFGGGGISEDIVITRSGDMPVVAQRTSISDKVLVSDTSKISLPIRVEVLPGIHRCNNTDTKAVITNDKEAISELDAWCIYTATDGTRVLYFDDMAEADMVKGAPFAKENDGIFYPKEGYGPYLWLKENTNEFNFYNVTPCNSGLTANINMANNVITFNYTVPQSASDHKDIMVATPDPVPGNFSQSVPLTFRHVLAAVNVKVGESIPEGTITSIKFTGVYNKGSYFPDSNEWTNRTKENGGEFNVILPSGGFTINESTAEGTSITTPSTSFMMIPQQLFTGAEIVSPSPFSDSL